MIQKTGMIKSIKGRLLFWFLLVALLPVLVTTALVYFDNASQIKTEVLETLRVINKNKKYNIETYFDQSFKNIGLFAKGARVLAFLEGQGNVEPLAALMADYSTHFKFHDVLVINKTGDVVATQAKEADFGTNVYTGKYKDTHFAKEVREVLDTRTTLGYSGYAFYEPCGGRPASFVVAAVYGADKIKIGAVAFQLSIDEIDSLLQDYTGLGETGETVWIGSDQLLRSSSRFDKDSILKTKTNAVAIVEALKTGASGTIIENNYRGVKTIKAYTAFKIGDVPEVLVTMIAVDEAFAPIVRLRNRAIFIVGLAGILVILVSLWVSKGLAGPITDLSNVAQRVAEGDLTADINSRQQGELGVLAMSFDTMLKNLREIVTKIKVASVQMTAATTEITAASQQQAASAREQASAMNETTAASRQLTKSSESVGETIHRVNSTVGHTLVGMGKIKVQIAEAGKTIARLGAKSVQIGKITELIDDVADQTNLLAVNAAIEAARAGEQGRGFSVVADEIRKLSDSTAKSTKEIAALIEEIQHEMANAVIGMEKSASSVEEEVHLTSEASEQAKEIAMISTQQISGTQQIAEAMEGLNEAMKQVAAGAQQSRASATLLNELAQDMATMAEKFKVS